jgi:hypothetical protein
MDQQGFDQFARWLVKCSSRRDMMKSGLGFAAAALLATVGRPGLALARSKSCSGKTDGTTCGGCGVCQGAVCVPNPDACGFCGTCDASLRCKPGNDGSTCSSCGVCRGGHCRAQPDLCTGACEKCKRAADGTPICASRCREGYNCCPDGHCLKAGTCCHDETECGQDQCCAEGVVCTSDGCCGSDGDTVCEGVDLTLCCHAGQKCSFNHDGAPDCCDNDKQACNGECCDASTQTCCGNACCDNATGSCLKDGYCCTGTVCKHPTNGTEHCCAGDEVCCNGVCKRPQECCAQCGVCSTCDTSDPAHPRCVPKLAQAGKSCGALGCGGVCRNGVCDPIAEGQPCLNGQTCCNGQCKDSCGDCGAGFHSCSKTQVDGTTSSICCGNDQPCCVGNYLSQCGVDPFGRCCPDKTAPCGDQLCCASGTICENYRDDAGDEHALCCPDGQNACNGECCPLGQDCLPSFGGLHDKECR